MPHLTMNLTERARGAMKEAAAQGERSMNSLIKESPEPRGSRALDTIEEIVANARANSGLSADDAMDLAVEETRRHREGR